MIVAMWGRSSQTMSRAPRIQGQSGERTCKELDGEEIMFRLKGHHELPHTVQSMNLMLESLSLDKSRLIAIAACATMIVPI